ncbi:hypothetical protein ON010_g17534 [Phytophthora cinnamomi]|nr:hypothetical protein ON010_g17534 [Phytophthora cinnamomi]
MSATTARHLSVNTQTKPFAHLPDIKQTADTGHTNNESTRFAPENTKRAQSTAISVFKPFLAKDNVTMDFVRGVLLADSNGAARS